jgi:glycine/D-amino acid oxidase-like deaminating enzyme
MSAVADAVVIGGGFYGCEVALALKRRGLKRVVIAEREPAILRRASWVNQARVHKGYHYPRSLPTAARSSVSFARFCRDYCFAIHRGRRKIYAIARGSRVAPQQFEHFCHTVGAGWRPLERTAANLFERSLVDAAYEVEEVAFDAAAIAIDLERRLTEAGVELRLGKQAVLAKSDAAGVAVDVGGERIEAGYLFNCTYSAIDAAGVEVKAQVKRELAEIALIEPPSELDGVGVTVVDGPFFSTMEFPAARCHSLSHVRYTPHEAWSEARSGDTLPAKSNAVYMLRDAQRYLPCMVRARLKRSLFEVKAVLAGNEDDDGRPILFEKSARSPRVISILGAKIDNIYDVLELIEREAWDA